MLLGIDLGTTYSCVAYMDGGSPTVIPNADGAPTTPSVVCFDGTEAWVGESANLRKEVAPQQIIEFVKHKMGQPVEVPPNLYSPDAPTAAPYEIGGFKYGAAGISAIILRKLKQDAITHFKRIGRLSQEIEEQNLDLDAIITVPSYFGDRERDNTLLAGYAAGLNVVRVINEPTAAALAYGMDLNEDQVIFVFDLGGGTCDVTILEISGGDTRVITSSGNNELGGRDWDELIQAFLWKEFQKRTGEQIPPSRSFYVQQKARTAKLELSEQDRTEVHLRVPTGEVRTSLHRRPPETHSEYGMDGDGQFYFEERAESLLQRCRSLCTQALDDAVFCTPDGRERPMDWDDIDSVVLAGGSTRMPMIADLVESVTGRRIDAHYQNFDHETAIAKGAAIYGTTNGTVQDVAAHSLGLEVIVDGESIIDHLIKKDTPLPVEAERTYKAGPNAHLYVYEGESTNPYDHDHRRGELALDNESGEVTVRFHEDESGFLRVEASYPPGVTEEVAIRNKYYTQNDRALPLRDQVQSIWINA
jgi:molecular chaperone DnaK